MTAIVDQKFQFVIDVSIAAHKQSNITTEVELSQALEFVGIDASNVTRKLLKSIDGALLDWKLDKMITQVEITKRGQ